mmetsp:Transcript_3547/g.8109  ORF Transcript_3547/g.8109 Transcript_3547/m.8109 type:complete len:362 (-) Transcript_3547:533-1618(-)
MTPHRRFLSTTDSSSASASTTTGTTTAEQAPNFEDTMDNLFTQSQKVAATDGDKWFADQALTQEAFDPKWWNLSDQAINAVQLVDDVTGFGYAGSILTVTCTLRACIFPLAVRGQRASSRMAHLQPELAMIKKRYEALGTPSQAEQKAFAENMQGLFKRYEVTPFAALATPLIQAPMFIGMFFGMRKLPDLFPEACSIGGLWWFTDLTVADPTYVLPLLCGLSFVATIESGKDQMIDSNPQHGPVIVNVFRAMAVVMVPVITTFPAAMLCYWVPNNFITMCQSIVLRNETVKKQFGIWDRPKPMPGQNNDAGFQETMSNLVKQVKGEPTTEKEKIEIHNKEIETRKRVQRVTKAARAGRRG